METQKEIAISDYLDRRKEEAKKAFQVQVDTLLREISGLSASLKSAKKRLLKLEYQ